MVLMRGSPWWGGGGAEIVTYTVTIGTMNYGGGMIGYGVSVGDPAFGGISPADARFDGYGWAVAGGSRLDAYITTAAPFRVIASYISGLVGLTSTADSGDHYVEIPSYTETPLTSGTTTLTLEWL